MERTILVSSCISLISMNNLVSSPMSSSFSKSVRFWPSKSGDFVPSSRSLQSHDKSLFPRPCTTPPKRVAYIHPLTSTLYISTMPRSFGTLISGNARRGCELTAEERSRIIAKREAGVLRKDLADKFRCTERCITNTIRRWKKHNTTRSLPRISRPKVVTRREKRHLYCLA